MINKIKSLMGWLPLTVAVSFYLFVTCVAGRFANEDVAKQSLITNGFSNVKLIDRSSVFVGFQGCDKYDLTKFKFSAINASGKAVTVYVCQGWPLKGATIRGM